MTRSPSMADPWRRRLAHTPPTYPPVDPADDPPRHDEPEPIVDPVQPDTNAPVRDPVVPGSTALRGRPGRRWWNVRQRAGTAGVRRALSLRVARRSTIASTSGASNSHMGSQG